MQAIPGASAGLSHPLAGAMLRFALLPSSWAHASRVAVPAGLEDAGTLLRHQAAALAREMRLEPAVPMDDPILPFALLPPPRFDRALQVAGAALMAGELRRVIAREPLARLREQLGDEALQFARSPAAPFAAGITGEPLDVDGARAQAARWGAALATVAIDDAGSAAGRRALLRLPAGLDAQAARLRVAGLAPRKALAALMDMVRILETEWLSSFPAAR